MHFEAAESAEVVDVPLLSCHVLDHISGHSRQAEVRHYLELGVVLSVREVQRSACLRESANLMQVVKVLEIDQASALWLAAVVLDTVVQQQTLIPRSSASYVMKLQVHLDCLHAVCEFSFLSVAYLQKICQV